MTATRRPRRKLISRRSTNVAIANIGYSIIQDCEDALTNWVTQNAAVKSSLSTRTRTLSQRRKAGGHDLADQDKPMGERGSWVTGEEHGEQPYGEEEEEMDEGEVRGREVADRAVAA